MSDGLDYVATWNSAQMLSEDMQKVMQALASRSKQQPHFLSFNFSATCMESMILCRRVHVALKV